MLCVYPRILGFLSALLLLLSKISALPESPESNDTRASSDRNFGIPHRRIFNAGSADPLRNAIETTRVKVATRLGWAKLTDRSSNSSAPRNASKVDNLAASSKTNESSRLATSRGKYVGYYVRSNDDDADDDDQSNDSKASAFDEAYGQQAVNYGPVGYNEYYPSSSYEYAEKYNTITDDQLNGGFDNSLPDPWRVSYIPHDYQSSIASDSYYLPPAVSPLSAQSCYCPTTRSHDCVSPTTSFLSLATALGGNLLALAQLTLTSSLPFLIPLLVVKLILVPLKILKLLKLAKLFLKLFVILPLLVRLVSPALSQFSLAGLFQQLQDAFPAAPQQGHAELETRERVNVSGLELDELPWDLRACPSRVACELGAYLASASRDGLPQSIGDFIARGADSFHDGMSKERGDSEDEEDDKARNEAFKAFFVALGKRWTMDRCSAYKCWVLSQL